MCRILGVARSHFFELRRHGPNQVTVVMKEYMHYAHFTGMTAGGAFLGELMQLLTDGIPQVEKAPSVQLKDVGEFTMRG